MVETRGVKQTDGNSGIRRSRTAAGKLPPQQLLCPGKSQMDAKKFRKNRLSHSPWTWSLAQEVVKSGFEHDHKINCNYDIKSRANLREGSGRLIP